MFAYSKLKCLAKRFSERKARERLAAEKRCVLETWDAAHSAYKERDLAGDTRGQHDRWPALRDATIPRLRLGV